MTETPRHHRRTDCRLCGSGALSLALALTPTPPANAFVPEDALAAEQPVFPLDVFLCGDCGHVQLLDVVDPKLLFENYVYVSGTSPVFVQHFRDYAEAVARDYLTGGTDGARVLDIGSNDGTLLKCFQDLGCRVLGVDPAKAIAAEATRNGIETIADFFSPDLAETIRAGRGDFDVVTANNVFAHADDLGGIADGVAQLLAEDGVFVFEVSYLVDVYEDCLFDTIYHEHVAYHSVTPLIPFFEAHGLELIDAHRVSTHGGSLRGVAQKAGGPRRRHDRVDALVKLEADLGLAKLETFHAFAAKIDALKRALTDLIGEIKADGGRIAAFGAPAKATTLMYHFGIGPDAVDFVIDDSPLKQGLFTPGMHIPVLASDALYTRAPEYVIVLAWNFADAIIAKHDKFRENGGRFIVPLPELKVI